ncbi:4,5-DOPA dioxygenase extradiol [Paucibacter oligotrophus]|uniref:4,5-DOPA dioxygenase extradiol n=2 Tax=Roseateles oligotrophus TaxID=1769250 RepID=A0A840L6B9_9BURK|nr:4,5-DOPA dioxygenase extradiol [Roseateles oligotrophus]
MTALEPREAGRFVQQLGQALDQQFGRPRAVLALSAHSLSRAPVLLAGPRHHAVYDFGGFDPKLQTLRYDAEGAPELAQQIMTLAAQAGLPMHQLTQGGLDHGIWTPLRYIYPEADVPVLPLAFSPRQSPAEQYALGELLAPLADQGVLILGSGSLTHNLGLVFGQGRPPAIDAAEIPASAQFREWMRARAAAGDWQSLQAYRSQAPHAAEMHPTDEHLLPFFIAAGAGGRSEPALRLHASLTFGSLAMDAYAFGDSAPRLAAALQGVEERTL